MATYSNNTTIKISGGVKKFIVPSGYHALYQVPANTELFVSDWGCPDSSTTLYFRDSSGDSNSSQSLLKKANARLGPGTQIWADVPAFLGGQIWLYCVEYVNTP